MTRSPNGTRQKQYIIKITEDLRTKLIQNMKIDNQNKQTTYIDFLIDERIKARVD